VTRLRVLTVRVDPATGLFDDAALVELQETCEVVSVSEHAFVYAAVPTLALVLRYRERTEASPSRWRAGATASRRPPPAEMAPLEDRALFEALRRWRNERARRDGRPAYVLFTNAQLLAVAATRPSTQAALQAIEGIGEARVRDYADEVLAVVGSIPAGSEVADDGQPPAGA
jgi:superfamily II DNA helicase RecQ